MDPFTTLRQDSVVISYNKIYMTFILSSNVNLVFKIYTLIMHYFLIILLNKYIFFMGGHIKKTRVTK